MKVKKGKVTLKSQEAEAIAIDQLFSILKDKQTPLSVCVHGKGVLVKKAKLSDQTSESVLGLIIPNAKLNDFYMEYTEIANGESLVAVVRKETISSQIQQLKEKGFTIIDLHIGPCIINCLSPVLSDQNVVKEIMWTSYSIGMISEGIVSLTKSNTPNQDRQENKPLLSFASAISQFSSWPEKITALSCDEITQARKQFIEGRYFNLGIASVAGFFLLLLLSNFFVFQHYWNKQQQLESEAGWQNNASEDLEVLKKQIQAKMEFALGSGLLTENKVAWLADQIGATVPDNVRLRGLTVYPRQKKLVEEEETFYFDQKRLIISGNCESESLLNNWLANLKQKPFTKKVTLNSFRQNEERNTGEFTIHLDLE